ncbi:hypothetical protein [Leptolyngbya sp. FACHB-17]|uniref:hypothetical protein n=1 Tax=unclassified Leptolyngbya TaxID=2650499 RepID=UPI001681145E|nr:hypothetical protein [Leptolyngbya sp. FACHB-17]MBD2082856.1 hypothetical protein [Leptolyngbya sp. FACHB-17]
MNQTVEKWLTIAALTGWTASIVSLVGLALRPTPPAIASRPVQPSSLQLVTRSKFLSNPSVSERLKIQQELASTGIPTSTSKDYWVKSLKER